MFLIMIKALSSIKYWLYKPRFFLKNVQCSEFLGKKNSQHPPIHNTTIAVIDPIGF